MLLGLTGGWKAYAEPREQPGEISYVVRFVGAGDDGTMIFNPQYGSAAEGISIEVAFPEKLIGSDGYLWEAIEQSPQTFTLYQAGTHKYEIKYQQGERVRETEDPEQDAKRKLEQWKEKAWKADCAITGQDSSGLPDPGIVVSNDGGNNARIKNLVSMISDTDWHSFYLIGRNYTPQTLLIGTSFPGTVYAADWEDTFSIGGESVQVLRVSVRRSFNPEQCTHRWSLASRSPAACLNHGSEYWQCETCGKEETIHLPASGHLDENHDALCDLCHLEMTGSAESHWWKEGDIQRRQIGGRSYRFRCVDENYSDSQDGHRRSALFLCESVIRADIGSNSTAITKLQFGNSNNYKTSNIRKWLQEQGRDSSFAMEPAFIGVNTAYTGSTAAGAREQLDESRLVRKDIGFQQLQDQLFCLSVEEALRYRDELWRFDSEVNNPESQISPYSQGYYLRTPHYLENLKGNFTYGKEIYAVDLVNGNIHTVGTDSETYGVRPAFTLPQS